MVLHVWWLESWHRHAGLYGWKAAPEVQLLTPLNAIKRWLWMNKLEKLLIGAKGRECPADMACLKWVVSNDMLEKSAGKDRPQEMINQICMYDTMGCVYKRLALYPGIRESGWEATTRCTEWALYTDWTWSTVHSLPQLCSDGTTRFSLWSRKFSKRIFPLSVHKSTSVQLLPQPFIQLKAVCLWVFMHSKVYFDGLNWNFYAQ